MVSYGKIRLRLWMQPMAAGQRVGDVIRVYKCLTKGRESLWRAVPGSFMRIQEKTWEEKFSSDTWRTGGWGQGEQSSSRVRLGAPEQAARGSGGIKAGPPRWADSARAPRAVPSAHSCPCCKHRNEEPASEFTILCLEVLLEKLFLPHSSIFRWELGPKGQLVLEINRGGGSAGKVS